ncbi:MAG: UvrD-helicase domain-containing protein, partial [Clostridiales bacterium]|nr:UvrD-helicase domain-containing protein [Clostridiales bacterium]
MDDLLEKLNDEQREAVLHDEGPLLILAGAGSGKTRVITYRIAYLIRVRGIWPSNILAITFTNKAANEMRERINTLIGDTSRNMWVGTFHSMFARILRRHAELLDYTPTYSILDSDDQGKVIKEVVKEMELNDKLFAPRLVQTIISKAKNDMQSPEEFSALAGGDMRLSTIARIYRRYNDRLLANNAMDFDDILFNTVRLFKENPDVLTMYQEKFRYILVDEYQDTNHCQYVLIQLLAKRYRNLCVVGDDDQSIYSFRGADLRNILDFEKDFKDAKVIKLEENYRSTATILNAANGVIAHNKKRKMKVLRTSGEDGDPITFLLADHHGIEAYYCAESIKRDAESGLFPYSDVAILYRMNALSRTIETALREKGIPY